MLLRSSALSITFGIVGCGLCNAADSAVLVIPGTLAIVSKRGATGFGEGACVISTAWHSAQNCRAKASPAPAWPISCADAGPHASHDAITPIDPISCRNCLMADTSGTARISTKEQQRSNFSLIQVKLSRGCEPDHQIGMSALLAAPGKANPGDFSLTLTSAHPPLACRQPDQAG